MPTLQFSDDDIRGAVTHLLTDEECERIRKYILDSFNFGRLALDAYVELGIYHYDPLEW